MPLSPRFTITNSITAVLTAIPSAWGFLEAATLSEEWIGRMGLRSFAAGSVSHHANRKHIAPRFISFYEIPLS